MSNTKGAALWRSVMNKPALKQTRDGGLYNPLPLNASWFALNVL